MKLLEKIRKRWVERPLSLEVNDAKAFDRADYRWIMIRLKASYFGRTLGKNELEARNFLVGRINPMTGELDYSIGDGSSPSSMGYGGFGYLRSTEEWVIFFGPWPKGYDLIGETLLIRLNAKGHSTVQRGAIKESIIERI